MKSFVVKTCGLSIVILGLIGCDIQSYIWVSKSDIADIKQQSAESNFNETEGIEGHKLIDVAGQAVISSVNNYLVKTVPAQSEPFIGRYRTTVSCNDPIVFCSEGNAELIINLLDNGTAHRIIIHSGKMAHTSNNYKTAYWSYNEKNHEITLESSNGRQFNFNIDDHKNLILDTAHLVDSNKADNKMNYSETDSFSHKIYVLRKDHNS